MSKFDRYLVLAKEGSGLPVGTYLLLTANKDDPRGGYQIREYPGPELDVSHGEVLYPKYPRFGDLWRNWRQVFDDVVRWDGDAVPVEDTQKWWKRIRGKNRDKGLEG
jgi:hypothetical protein